MLARTLLLFLVVALPSLARAQCKTTAGCPVAGQSGTQLCVPDSARIMERGSRNRILANGPTLPQIGAGCTATKSVDPSVPCVLTKAIGYVESTWTQFCAPACSGSGLTVISFDCGYGVMQVTSGMSGGAGFDPMRVAKETQYNIGTGLKILCDKWRATPCVGDNQPTVLEDWYFATWAYNSFGFVNNPNNPSFPPSRPPFNGAGSLSRGSYPYQEIVWGYLRNPPGSPKRWDATAVSYPTRSEICNTAGCRQTAKLSEPLPSHGDPCQTLAPRDDAQLVSETPNPIVTTQGVDAKKTWRLRNTGDTVWSKAAGYALVRTSTETLNGPATVDLPDGVSFFGEDVADFQITLRSNNTGPQAVTYALQKGGTRIGPELTANLNVSTSTDADGDGHNRKSAGGDDCNVDDPRSYPGAPELCDGHDNDCDGINDNGITRTCSSACGLGTEVCLQGEFKNCTAILPRVETCDGTDEDCNGVVDDGNLCGAGKTCLAATCQTITPPPDGTAPKGCGCSSGEALASPLLSLAAILLARRRRGVGAR